VTKVIGLITRDLPGIGDKLVVSSFPENIYKNTGNKVIDVDNCRVFDYNPYVLRQAEYEVGMRHEDICALFNYKNVTKPFISFPERAVLGLGLEKVYLRNPRLYAYEDATQEKKICLHSSGSSKDRHIPQEAIANILDRYPYHEIIQIGYKKDIPLSEKFPRIIDRTSEKSVDAAFWETAYEIATCEIYIGIDSGWVHMANAYNRVRKKIFLNYGEDLLENFVPNVMNPNPSLPVFSNPWFDFNWEYYNTFKRDIGVTRSYIHI